MMHFRLQSLLKVLVLVIVCMMGMGCATIYNLTREGGNSRSVTIRTEPSGAGVFYKGQFVGKTPCDLYIDMKQVHDAEFASIFWNNVEFGRLQLIEDYVSMGNSTPGMLDLCTVLPFIVDVILLLPVKIIRTSIYDSPDCKIVYNEHSISLGDFPNNPQKIPDEYIRLISPFSNLFAIVKKDSYFFGWDKDGICHINSKEQGGIRGLGVNDIANVMNSFSSSIQQAQVVPPQPAPHSTSPAPRPTSAAPAPTNTQRTVTPTTPNFKRFCPRTYKSGVVHGEWDSRFSAGCPACRGTINW